MIAKTFFGLERVLADELTALGALEVRLGRRMVAFRGDARLMMRANIHCRTAVRVLRPIASFEANDEQALYRGMGLIEWHEHLDADGSLAIDPVVHSSTFGNSLYAAQLAKDAIVDQFRQRTSQRPSVDLNDPDLRLNLHIDQQRVTVYLDSSGDSLHKRGYRVATGDAPINEVLAAGILRLTGWDEQSPLADFMCGSGTLVIEAALMARRLVPGLLRKSFGYTRWKDFDRALHEELLAEARREVLPSLSFPLQGSDIDPAMIDAARQNARRAGVDRDIQWIAESFSTIAAPPGPGTLVTNPPYDERMKTAQIEAVYRRLGDALKRNWAGYAAHIFTGNLAAARTIGLRPGAKIKLFNGPIECRLLRFDMVASVVPTTVQRQVDRPVAEQGDAFCNRLARMSKHWHRWARRQGITCYRIYDRDVPEVPLSIDWYEGQVLVVEHERPHSRTEIEHRDWLRARCDNVVRTLDVPKDRVTMHERLGGRASARAWSGQAHEAGATFEVRFERADDTGLELDRRILRTMVREQAAGKRVLDLFGGTGTFAVAAATGGAASTTVVEDLPAQVEWARRNFALNRMAAASHRVVCADPLDFLAGLASAAKFDLVVATPPGFDGRWREGVWNVQDGHVELLNRLIQLVAPGGLIYFVTTFRRLKLHDDRLTGATAREITRQTIPPDFRDMKVHRAWSLRCAP